MASQKDYMYFYAVEEDDGYKKYFNLKEEAVATGKPVIIEGFSKDEIHEFVTKNFNRRETNRRLASRGAKAQKEKYSKEVRAEWRRKAGKAGADQRWGDKTA